MTDPQDIRWHQRFSNYEKAVRQLNKFVQQKDLNELEQQGLIQAFEYTHELAWKVMKDFLLSRGSTEPIFGSKDATREAFKLGLISEGETWMQMITHRNLTSHIYDEDKVNEVNNFIRGQYAPQFNAFYQTMLKQKEQEQA